MERLTLPRSITTMRQPQESLVGAHRDFYTSHYADRSDIRIDNVFTGGQLDTVKLDSKDNLSDSPKKSRESIIKKLRQFQITKKALTTDSVVLDLGAGRQILEVEFEATNEDDVSGFKTITLDIATITADQLLIPHYFPRTQNKYLHIQGDGANMPLADGSIDLAVSNMAIDFMPERAKAELFRVLKNGATVFLNLHHPSRLSPNLEQLLKKQQQQMIRRAMYGGKSTRSQERVLSVLRHDKFLLDNNVLFSDPEEIKKAFNKYGFIITSVQEGQEDINKWWEVEMIKPKVTI